MRLLDVGCGPGSITRGLAERVAPGEVIGLDLSKDTLEDARRDAAARGLTNLKFQEGSVYALPFADGVFDVVYAHQVFQHLRERDAALREMLRVLRSGGLAPGRGGDRGPPPHWPRRPRPDRGVGPHRATGCRHRARPRRGPRR